MLVFYRELLYYNSNLSLEKASLFLKGGKGVIALNNSDVILHLVDMIIAEKEKNFELRLQQQESQQIQDENSSKD